jgi:hypothetical protein
MLSKTAGINPAARLDKARDRHGFFSSLSFSFSGGTSTNG